MLEIIIIPFLKLKDFCYVWFKIHFVTSFKIKNSKAGNFRVSSKSYSSSHFVYLVENRETQSRLLLGVTMEETRSKW